MTIVVVCILVVGSYSYAGINFDENKPAPTRKLFFEGAVGVDFRTDNSERIDQNPSITGKLFFFINPSFSIVSGISYTEITGVSYAGIHPPIGIVPELGEEILENNASSAVVGFELGLRAQERGRLINPFVEVGLDTRYYSATVAGINFTDTKTGFGVRVGAAIPIGGHGHLDLSVHHVQNYIDNTVYVLEGTLNPNAAPIPEGYIGQVTRLGENFFNPTTLELVYRFDL
jgi:hypothetical protein